MGGTGSRKGRSAGSYCHLYCLPELSGVDITSCAVKQAVRMVGNDSINLEVDKSVDVCM